MVTSGMIQALQSNPSIYSCRLLTEEELFSPQLWENAAPLAPYSLTADPAFIRSWWSAFRGDRTLAALQVYDRENHLCALLPMFVFDKPYFRNMLIVRELRFFMDEPFACVPRAPLFVHPAHAANLFDIVRAAADFLLLDEAFRIERILLGPFVERPNMDFEMVEEEETLIDLEARREDSYRGVSEKTASNIERRLKRLNREYPDQWSVDFVAPDEYIIRQFVEIKCDNWTGANRCTFADPRMVDFTKGAFLGSGNSRCLVCRIQDKIAGIDLLVRDGDKAFSYNTCFDNNYRNQGIGRLMTHKLIEHYAPTRKRLSLGVGSQKYKADWGVAVVRACRVNIWQSRLKKLKFDAAKKLRSLVQGGERESK